MTAEPKVFCVRAEYGRYAPNFLSGGYAAIGWLDNENLGGITVREQIYPLYRVAYPDDSNIVVGQQVGQIARFLLDIRPGDYVITPATNTEWLHYGVVGPDSYFFFGGEDGCPFRQRRRVAWVTEPLRRGSLSIPLQNTLGSSLTVFSVSQSDEFLLAIGKGDLAPKAPGALYDPYRAVLEQVLELDATEFELLVARLLAAIGFEGAEHTGKTGDGGVDATGELSVAGLAKVKIFVQAKRYKLGMRISGNVVRQLRMAIPAGAQGAFITTADFDGKAGDVALEPGFPRIGLVNGRQLVDLLVEHWDDIPPEFQERLGLRRGLVRV